jgi:hypothetical protein
MSKEIVCIRAEAAESTLPQYILCHKNISKNLRERLQRKLNTKNPYLLTIISRAIFYLDWCSEEVDTLRNYGRRLSRGPAILVIKTASTRLLDNIKRLESLIQPLEYDWVTIPWNVRSECATVIEALFLVVVDMCFMTGIARFAYTSRSDLSKYADSEVF